MKMLFSFCRKSSFLLSPSPKDFYSSQVVAGSKAMREGDGQRGFKVTFPRCALTSDSCFQLLIPSMNHLDSIDVLLLFYNTPTQSTHTLS